MVNENFAARDFLALYLNNVSVRVYFGVIGHSHGRNNHTHIHSELFTENYNTVNEVSAALFVNQPQQRITKFHFDRLNVQQFEYVIDITVVIVVRFRLFKLRLFRFRALSKLQFRHFFLVTVKQNRRRDKCRAQNQHYGNRETRYEHHYNNHDTRNQQYERLRRKLRLDIVHQTVVRRRTSYNHTCRNRNQKRGDLRTQTGTDCRQRISVQYGIEITASANHTDDNTADKVYKRCDNGHYSVALYELRGTVHRAVKVRFTLNV